jgi:uncharacterized protein (DUF885 family)
LNASTRTLSSQLESVAADYWSALLERHPRFATTVSVHDHDDRLEDIGPEARDAWVAEVAALRERLSACSRDGLTDVERVTAGMLAHELDSHFIAATMGFDRWSVDQLVGPQVDLFELVRVHAVKDAGSMRSFLARVRAMPGHVDQHVANLRSGLADGLVAPRCTVVRVVQQIGDVLAAGVKATTLITQTADRPADVPEADWARFRSDLEESVGSGLLPALARYGHLLETDILPRAREIPGLASLPGGEDLYRQAIRIHLTIDRTPAELHDVGLREMERIRGEMERLCHEQFAGLSLPESLELLRRDRKYSFSSREEIVAKAESAVRRATEAANRCFDLLPDHECTVQPIDAHAEKSAPAAYYMGPAPDGTRPGTYYINTYKPEDRPRHEAEVVAFHEAVPGHHLQIALAQKMEGVPEFQKHSHSTAYVEGWALYTERLADELGLYTGPMDRLGMFSCDAWRASRLVVDTGLHAHGWTREQAIAYMAANTAASMTDIENEVDRYVAWPGQALAYKTGQLEILALRRAAEKRLGTRFELKGFHRAVLGNGGVTLPILREQVERWIDFAASR